MAAVDARERQLTALEPLELRHLPEDGLVFEEALPVEWLRATVGNTTRGLTFLVRAPGHVKLEVTPLGPLDQRPPIRLRGAIRATVETDCVRCLSPVSPAVEADVDFTLLPAAPDPEESADGKGGRGPASKAKAPGDGRVEDWGDAAFPDPEALADAVYRGETIDVPDLIREALLLGLTTDPVCEDTAGCDARTAALIDAANQPVRDAETAIDPRWAALAELRTSDDDPS